MKGLSTIGCASDGLVCASGNDRPDSGLTRLDGVSIGRPGDGAIPNAGLVGGVGGVHGGAPFWLHASVHVVVGNVGDS